jgi:26S proteasome regulatory subunit T2
MWRYRVALQYLSAPSKVAPHFANSPRPIFYGPPGTGKTLLAKAVANETSATFLRVVGSELIQKYLGDGPKLVREIFRVAEENSPSIVFIDEIDAVGTKRYDSTSGGEREIQRTMLELLNQLDGFDSRGHQGYHGY